MRARLLAASSAREQCPWVLYTSNAHGTTNRGSRAKDKGNDKGKDKEASSRATATRARGRARPPEPGGAIEEAFRRVSGTSPEGAS